MGAGSQSAVRGESDGLGIRGLFSQCRRTGRRSAAPGTGTGDGADRLAGGGDGPGGGAGLPAVLGQRRDPGNGVGRSRLSDGTAAGNRRYDRTVSAAAACTDGGGDGSFGTGFPVFSAGGPIVPVFSAGLSCPGRRPVFPAAAGAAGIGDPVGAGGDCSPGSGPAGSTGVWNRRGHGPLGGRFRQRPWRGWGWIWPGPRCFPWGR